MASYKVLVNDNAHYMDITEATEHGLFASADEAVAAAKKSSVTTLRGLL
jgi:hypothetical protein